MEQQNQNQKWDTDYEWKVVTLLALGFGLVGLDRWILSPLFPQIQEDLGLQPGDVAYFAGALGMVWGLFAIFTGRLSDKIGHRKVLIPAIILFSLMSGFSGMAGSFAMLIFIRALMGAAEGTYCPTSFTAVGSAAKPERRGFLQGLQQSGFALLGLALAPLIAVGLLEIVPSWRWVLWIVAIPGLIVGVLLYFVLREPQETQGGALIGAGEAGGNWIEVLKVRNIVLCMIGLLCAMAGVFTLSAMVPIYVDAVLGISGFGNAVIASALGFGGFFGQFGWPALSDKFGRKPMAIIGFVGATLSIYWFAQTGASVTPLFIALFAASFFCLGNVALITGPIATESAPVGLISAGIGVVVGAGEIFGGGMALGIAGAIVNAYGLPSMLNVALVGVAAGIVVMLFLKETAPSKVPAVQEPPHMA